MQEELLRDQSGMLQSLGSDGFVGFEGEGEIRRVEIEQKSGEEERRDSSWIKEFGSYMLCTFSSFHHPVLSRRDEFELISGKRIPPAMVPQYPFPKRNIRMRPYPRFALIPPGAYLRVTASYRETIHRPDGPYRISEAE
jgi:hypothetical protein